MTTTRETQRFRHAAGGGRLGPKARESRRALLSALDALLETTAWHALTVRDIAAAAELSPASFYQYFSGLEDAVLELDRAFERSRRPRPRHLELVVELVRFERTGSAAAR